MRVCRLLHYFLDRPELGQLILTEAFALFLGFACRQDARLAVELYEQCEHFDSAFGNPWELSTLQSTINGQQQHAKRIDEARKTLNSMLNALDAGFLWEYLERLLISNLSSPSNYNDDDSPRSSTDEPNSPRRIDDEEVQRRKEMLNLYPLIVVYCVRTVQLDSHSDIRGRHLTKLMRTILDQLSQRGCDAFARDTVVALLVVVNDFSGSSIKTYRYLKQVIMILHVNSKFFLFKCKMVPMRPLSIP